jgi:hypothetical protein
MYIYATEQKILYPNPQKKLFKIVICEKKSKKTEIFFD